MVIRQDLANDVTHIDSLLASYLLGDKAGLLSVTQEQPEVYAIDWKLQKRLGDTLLNRRNIMMTKTVEHRLVIHPYKSHFIVAGSLHFLGEGSIVQILRKRGYTVIPVE